MWAARARAAGRRPCHRTGRIVATVLVVASVGLVLGGCTNGSSGDEAQGELRRPYDRAEGPSEGCDEPDPALTTTTEGRFEHAGVERSYNLTIPADAGSEPLPLVVSLHGALGRDDGHDRGTGLAELAESEGFVLLTPQAAGGARAWEIQPDADDAAFLLALLDHVEQGVCIDRSRVFATGFSMGALMATTLSCLHPGRFAAVAPVSGLGDVPACTEERKRTPLISFHGSEDTALRADGGYDGRVRVLSGLEDGPSRQELAAAWATALGCASPPTVVESPPETTTTYSCPGGADVELHLVQGAGHHWPGGRSAGAASGAVDGEPDATALIWSFFEAQEDGR